MQLLGMGGRQEREEVQWIEEPYRRKNLHFASVELPADSSLRAFFAEQVVIDLLGKLSDEESIVPRTIVFAQSIDDMTKVMLGFHAMLGNKLYRRGKQSVHSFHAGTGASYTLKKNFFY